MDGIDLDLEGGSPNFYSDFVQKLAGSSIYLMKSSLELSPFYTFPFK
jgi:hypothetical protein